MLASFPLERHHLGIHRPFSRAAGDRRKAAEQWGKMYFAGSTSFRCQSSLGNLKDHQFLEIMLFCWACFEARWGRSTCLVWQDAWTSPTSEFIGQIKKKSQPKDGTTYLNTQHVVYLLRAMLCQALGRSAEQMNELMNE